MKGRVALTVIGADHAGRHEAYYKSKGKQTIHLPSSHEDVVLEKDELLHIEWSYKAGSWFWIVRKDHGC